MVEEIVDIFHIEDNPSFVKRMVRAAEKNGASYFNASCLEAVERALGEGIRGKFYLVDGSFPIAVGGDVEERAEEGIKLIRSVDPNAAISLYSGNWNTEENARVWGVGAYLKGKWFPGVVVEEICARIRGASG